MAKIMTVRPPENLHLWLKDAACEMGIPLNSLILKILWEWAEQEKQQKNETTKSKEGNMSKAEVKQFSGKKLGIIRKKKGYTQLQLAAVTGISRTRLAQFEMGDCPNFNQALVLADELECDIYDFCQ